MPEPIPVQVHTLENRHNASTGSRWEPIVGYSRAVRIGATIAVTGTVGIEPDGSFSPSVEAQARRALEIIQAALVALGGSVRDVIRTRIYMIDISRWEEAGRAHGAVFAQIRPATTLVQVARLIDDAALIEIEADAIVQGVAPPLSIM